MNYPAAPNGGIAASIGQATGYQAEIIIAPRGGELTPCPPLVGLSASAGLVRRRRIKIAANFLR